MRTSPQLKEEHKKRWFLFRNSYTYISEGKIRRDAPLPKTLLRQLLERPHITEILYNLSTIRAEMNEIKNKEPAWKDSIGRVLHQQLSNKIELRTQEAGRFLLAELDKQHTLLTALNTDFTLLTIEIAKLNKQSRCLVDTDKQHLNVKPHTLGSADLP